MKPDAALLEIGTRNEPNHETVRRLVHEYLVHSCYAETAASLSQISSADTQDMDLDAPTQQSKEAAIRTLSSRKSLFRMITEGHIAEAIQLCEHSFPEVLINENGNPREVLFALKCQDSHIAALASASILHV